MAWFKQLLGGAEGDEKASLFDPLGQAILVDLAPLAKKNASLMREAVRYVTTGQSEEVLLKLRSGQAYGEALGLRCCRSYYTTGDRPRAIFATFAVDKPAVYLRLARVYEAAAAAANPDWAFLVPGVSRWLDIFIQEATGLGRYAYGDHARFPVEASASFIDRMCEAAGEPTEMLVRAVFLLDAKDYYNEGKLRTLTALAGFRPSISNHAAAVLEALAHPEHRQRVQALNLLYHDEIDLAPFKEQIVLLACGQAKTVREAAEKIVVRMPALFLDLLARILREGDNLERLQAVRLYARMDQVQAVQVLKERLPMETAPKVKAAIEAALVEPAEPTDRGEASDSANPEVVAIEPLPDVDQDAPLPEEIEQDLARILRNYNEYARAFNKAHEKEKHFFRMDLVQEGSVHKAFTLLQHLVLDKHTSACWGNVNLVRADASEKEWRALIAKPQIQMIHVLRLLILLGHLNWQERPANITLTYLGEQWIQHFFDSHHLPADARITGAAAQAIGIRTYHWGWNYLRDYSLCRRVIRNPQDYWMFFAENQEILEEALGFRPPREQIRIVWERETRTAAFSVLAAFPRLPSIFHAKLWELALEGPKGDRPLAQRCLPSVPGKEARIAEALKDGRQEVRAGAAQWLAELRWDAAVPALKRALALEKSDIAKGAIMEALEALGVATDEFLNRDSLLQEAKKALAKGVPTQLQWFPFATLPPVHWENGQQIDPAVVQWLIVLGYKLGSPEPSPAIRRYCKYMKADDRRALGQYVLQSWLTQDTLPRYTLETATPEARNRARQMRQWFKEKTEDQLTQEILPGLLSECLTSAIKEKGILAIPASCCGMEAVAPVEAYLKKWYGHRVHQCRALVQMLAWNEHPLATQLLLSVANRFRTKGIQEQAHQCVQDLAERQGWTLDELADRTIPTAGFDEQGRLTLDFGAREFICRLDEELELGIFTGDGKQLKGLPDAGKGDDPELAKAAKAELAATRKILKQVLRLQVDRLYENMCTQRTWRFADLRQFLLAHPLVGRLCQRLVWTRCEGGRNVETFRPLADLTLTDIADQPVKPADDAVIRLAHSCNTDPDTAAAWGRHFADYEEEPLFAQFGRAQYKLEESDREACEVTGFLGYMLDNFKLRGLAVKAGYQRGQAEDGGVFCQYKKRFPGLKMEAIIEFSGVPLPEENVRVALKTLYFSQLVEGGPTDYFAPDYRIPLAEVPAVLLSECWNDLRLIAEAGFGFDPDWEKKVDY